MRRESERRPGESTPARSSEYRENFAVREKVTENIPQQSSEWKVSVVSICQIGGKTTPRCVVLSRFVLCGDLSGTEYKVLRIRHRGPLRLDSFKGDGIGVGACGAPPIGAHRPHSAPRPHTCRLPSTSTARACTQHSTDLEVHSTPQIVRQRRWLSVVILGGRTVLDEPLSVTEILRLKEWVTAPFAVRKNVVCPICEK